MSGGEDGGEGGRGDNVGGRCSWVRSKRVKVGVGKR